MHIMQIMVNISDGIKRLNHNSKLIIAQNKQTLQGFIKCQFSQMAFVRKIV